jgi:hypothetical protein
MMLNSADLGKRFWVRSPLLKISADITKDEREKRIAKADQT